MTHMTFIPFLHQSTRISPPPSIHHCQEAQAAQAAHAAHAQREAQVAREQREAVREVEQRLGCGEVWQLMCSHSIRVWKMFMMFVFVGFQGGVYNMNYSKYNYRK